MTMFRAVYQSPPKHGGRIRGFTFAASDATQAARIAESWTLNDKLLTLRAIRPLQRTVTQRTLELTP